MYARVSPYRLKPGCREKAIAMMEAMKTDIMALPGLTRFMNLMKDDGSGYVVAIVNSAEQARKNEPRERELWAAFADVLEELPVTEGCEVPANWQV